MTNWPDPTAAPAARPARGPGGPPMTTVRLPQSDNPTHPYRYLIGYAHRVGYGDYVADLDEMVDTQAKVIRLEQTIERRARSQNVATFGLTLIAGPRRDLVTHRVPVSDTPGAPYRYMIGYRHDLGFGTYIDDGFTQFSTAADLEALRYRVRHGLAAVGFTVRTIALLTITPMAGPE